MNWKDCAPDCWQDRWEDTKKRLIGAWTMEPTDRPCVNIQAPIEIRERKPRRADLTEAEYRKIYTDPDMLYESMKARMSNLTYIGEGYPVVFSNFGTAGHAKYFKGCNFQYSKDTVWYKESIESWDSFTLEENPAVLEEEKAVLSALAKRSTGEFFVSMPDNCGVMDALEHLRGNINLLYDLIDEPERILASCKQITQTLKRATAEFYDVLRENNDGGSVHGWMNTFATGTSLQLQADCSVMLSPADYETFIMPELSEMTEFLDYSAYHLDGQEQIRHLDMILSLKRLNMIQWTPVAGQPPVSEFIPVLQRIQNAGKGLVLFAKMGELEKLVRALIPEGVIINVQGGPKDVPEGLDLFESIKRWSRESK